MAAMVDLTLFPSAARRNIPRIFLTGQNRPQTTSFLTLAAARVSFQEFFFFEAKK
jgi:hypothetical protein